MNWDSIGDSEGSEDGIGLEEEVEVGLDSISLTAIRTPAGEEEEEEEASSSHGSITQRLEACMRSSYRSWP